MTSTVFQDFVTPVPAAWLNDVNVTTYTALGSGGVAPTTGAQVISNLGLLTASVAASTYLTQANATATYLTQANAATTYAPLASPTFTGTPSLPTGTTGVTQAATDSSTKLATTAYTTTAVVNAQTFPFRNAFINGDDQINQVAQGAAVTITAGAAINYATDQWYVQSTGQNITAQQVAGTAPFQYAYKLLSGATGPTTTLFGTRIEGRDCVKFVNQTMVGQVGIICDVARTVTWTAYYANAVDNFSTKTQIATGTINATTGQITYTYSFNAGANAGNGIAIEFTTGALTNSTGFITYSGRQLEKVPSGITTGTVFEFLPFETQLRRCQRYLPYWSAGGVVTTVLSGGASTSTTTNANLVLSFPVQLRVPPTAVVVSNGSHFSLYSTAVFAGSAVTISSVLSPTTMAVQLGFTVATTTAGQGGMIYFNNSAAYLYLTGAQL